MQFFLFFSATKTCPSDHAKWTAQAANFFKTMTATKKRYPEIGKECLAIVYA